MNTKILFFDCEATFGGRDQSLYNNNYILFLLFFIAAGFVNNTTSNIDENGIEEMKILNNLTEAFSIKV